MEQILSVTDKAAEKFKAILKENDLPEETSIRVFLKAGGCSGFSVEIEVEQNEPDKRDNAFEENGVNFVVDKKSSLFLRGTEIDWKGGIMGGFQFNPPNATGGCGCGVSFSFE